MVTRLLHISYRERKGRAASLPMSQCWQRKNNSDNDLWCLPHSPLASGSCFLLQFPLPQGKNTSGIKTTLLLPWRSSDNWFERGRVKWSLEIMAKFFLDTLMEVREDVLLGVFCILTLVLQVLVCLFSCFHQKMLVGESKTRSFHRNISISNTF